MNSTKKVLIKNKGGFTLIELLVVIAIIGILSAIIMVSLSSIQKKSKDNASITSMNQLRVSAEMDYNVTNSFASLCPTSSGANGRYDTAGAGDAVTNYPFLTSVKTAQAALMGTSGAISDLATITCASTVSSYAISIKLYTGYFCVDSTNFADKRVTGGLSGDTCPAS